MPLKRNDTLIAKKKRQAQIVPLRLQGKSLYQIAQEIGSTKATVWKDLQDKDVKEKIDNAIKYYSMFAPVVQEGFAELLVDPEKDIRLKAIQEYHKVMGITGSQTSVFIQNILNIQGNVTLSPRMQSLLTQHPDIIDVTPYNDTSKSQLTNNFEVLDAEMVD